MILVILGTQKQKFTRLLDAIENSSLDEEILVQSVNSEYISTKMKIVSFIPFDEMKSQIQRARLVITHGGTGSIIQALESNKVVVACARMKKYGEHLDDHQQELIATFADAGYLLELPEGEDLNRVLAKIDTFVPRRFESNNVQFLVRLKNSINAFLTIE